jgi:hypothetical protein
MPTSANSAPVAIARMPPVASTAATQIRTTAKSDMTEPTKSLNEAPNDNVSQPYQPSNNNSSSEPTLADKPGENDAEEPKSSIVREGSLTRRSVNTHLGMHRWKKQYFVLDDRSSMAYYHHKSGALRGQIVLTHDTNVRPFPNRKNAFEVATPTGSMVMQSKTNADMEHWINGVRTVIRALEVRIPPVCSFP